MKNIFHMCVKFDKLRNLKLFVNRQSIVLYCCCFRKNGYKWNDRVTTNITQEHGLYIHIHIFQTSTLCEMHGYCQFYSLFVYLLYLKPLNNELVRFWSLLKLLYILSQYNIVVMVSATVQYSRDG